MPPLVRHLVDRCTVARAGLLRSTCSMPFARIAGTPLEPLADNYLSLVTGFGLFGGTGSAIVLRPGLAVTSAHVLRRHERLTAQSSIGPVPVELVARSDRLDLAVLAVPHGIGRELRPAPAAVDLPVWAMGTTTGTLSATVAGRIENVRAVVCVEAESEGPFQEGIMYAAEAGPGYSGGPLVDGRGRLLGMTEGIYTRMFGACPADWPDLPRMFAYHAEDVFAEAERLLGIS